MDAIQQHDDDALYNWLAEAISYQGISDTVASGYIEQHGTVEAADVRAGLDPPARCHKLTSHWHFENCGYRKTTRRCNEPRHIRRCPLPKHDLRNGHLNQAAYSLHLFMRDICGGDLVAWIDSRLARADKPKAIDRAKRLHDAVLVPLKNIYGVSDKILNMTLASLLLAGDPERERWVVAGASMVAVDTLVHNWLHRTGILRGLDVEHAYGTGCYAEGRCTDIIRAVANEIDASAYNSDYPQIFPRFVQKAIWRFCAQQEFDQCNGNRIDDSRRCSQSDCILFDDCARLKLGRSPSAAIAAA